MARIRSVHPGLFTDEAWVSCSAMARILVIGLWTEADDQGAFEWKPIQLKMRLLPADAADVSALLDEIEANGLIKRFNVGGKVLGAIRNFRRFQRPKTPSNTFDLTDEMRVYVGLPVAEASSFPQNGEMSGDDETPFPQNVEKSPQMEDGGWREGGKKQENGKLSFSEKENPDLKSDKPTRLPADFQLSPADRSEALAIGIPEAAIAETLVEFKDYWAAKPGKSGLSQDWPANWRRWCRKRAEDRGYSPAALPGSPAKPAYVTIKPGTEQWDAWYRYKQRIGVSTRLMDEARNNDGAFVVPTDFPPSATATAA